MKKVLNLKVVLKVGEDSLPLAYGIENIGLDKWLG